jgi:MHS family proline/betaine transporter-like MFS transporter
MAQGGFVLATLGQLLLWIPVAIYSGVCPAFFAELFPARVRTASIAFPHAVATAIFSGTAPLLSALLISATGSVIAPGWYLIGAAIVTGATVIGAHETGRVQLRVE